MKFSIPIETQSIHPDPTACLANAHAKDGPQANAGIKPLSNSKHSEMILHDTKDFYILLPLFEPHVVFVKGLGTCCNQVPESGNQLFQTRQTVITWNKNPDPIPFLPRFLSLNKSPFFSAAHRCSVDKQQTSRKGNKVQITSAIHKVVQLVGAVVCQSKDSASYQNVLCVTPSQ